MRGIFKLGAIAAVALLALTGTGYFQSNEAAHPPNYREARGIFWNELYTGSGNTLYCGAPLRRAGKRSGNVNIEHVFPMGWVTNALRCGSRKECRKRSDRFNHIEADLHNLYPALKKINTARLSMSFAILNYRRPLYPGCHFKIDRQRYLAEPPPVARGRIARAMFYMSEQYHLRIHPRQGRLLQQWNRTRPPDTAERKRNNTIEKIQGNRNPYIDNPQRAERLRFN